MTSQKDYVSCMNIIQDYMYFDSGYSLACIFQEIHLDQAG